MQEPEWADGAWAVRGLIAEEPPEKIGKLARWQVEDIMERLLRHGDYPGRYQDRAVFRRADQESDADIRSEEALGVTITDDERARYQELYRHAFLDAWRNPATLAAIREKRSRSAGVIFVCMR